MRQSVTVMPSVLLPAAALPAAADESPLVSRNAASVSLSISQP